MKASQHRGTPRSHPRPKAKVDELGELNDGSEALKVVLTYYGKWSAPPPDVDRRKFYADECLPNVDYNWIVRSRRFEVLRRLHAIDARRLQE